MESGDEQVTELHRLQRKSKYISLNYEDRDMEKVRAGKKINVSEGKEEQDGKYSSYL